MSVPLKLIASAAAFALVAILLIVLDSVSYMLAWKNKMPPGPRPNWTTMQRVNEAEQIEVTPISVVQPKPRPCMDETIQKKKNAATEGWKISAEKPEPEEVQCGKRNSAEDLYLAIGALLITLLFSFLFGWSWPFLNRSTHQSIYTSRLIRAYLGASNRDRLMPNSKGVTQAIPGDDIKQEEYWPRFQGLAPASGAGAEGDVTNFLDEEQKFLGKGMPLHLVNVTINETLDARSQVEQRDRKGIGMAVGPAAISAGVFHHVVLCEESEDAFRSKSILRPTKICNLTRCFSRRLRESF